jgi:hypothetical protein
VNDGVSGDFGSGEGTGVFGDFGSKEGTGAGAVVAQPAEKVAHNRTTSVAIRRARTFNLNSASLAALGWVQPTERAVFSRLEPARETIPAPRIGQAGSAASPNVNRILQSRLRFATAFL